MTIMTLPKKIWKKNLLNRVAHSAMHGAHRGDRYGIPKVVRICVYQGIATLDGIIM